MNNFIKFLIILVIAIVAVGIFITFDVFGVATQNLTLTTNTDLENGLINHWSFDGPYNINSVPASGADGSETQIAGTGLNDATVGGLAWTSPTNVTANNNTDAEVDSKAITTNYLKGENFGFTIPTGSTIDGIAVDYERWQEENDGEDWVTTEFKLYTGSATTSNVTGMNTTMWNTVRETITEGGVTETWGRSWSASEINSSGFGVALSANRPQSNGPSRWGRVDYFQITVYHSAVPAEVGSTTDRISGTDYDVHEAQVSPGQIGEAWDFDGTDDYIDIGDAQPSSSDVANTIAFWINADDATSESIIDINGTNEIITNGSDQITIDGGAGPTYYVDGVSGGRVITDGKWHHVVITDSTGWDPTNMDIGRDGTAYFGGKIDDVRFYNRVLSQAEVDRLYGLGATTHINVTLDTNSDLESGLKYHYTHDAEDIDWNATLEIINKVPGGLDGNVGALTADNVGPGKIGQALVFPSTNAYYSSLEDDLPTGDFTYSLWFRPVSTGSFQTLINAPDSAGGGSREFAIFFDGVTGNFDVYLDSSGTIFSTTQTVDLKKWSHVLVRRNGSDVEVFVNGIKDPTSAIDGGTLSYPCSMFIGVTITASGGSCGGSLNFDFEGSMDDVRVYNKALSDSEVLRLYELGATTHINKTLTTNPDLENGLVWHYTFDGKHINWSASNEVIDRTDGDPDAGFTGVTMDYVRPGKIGQALDFSRGTGYAEMKLNSNIPTGDFTYSVWINPRGTAVSLVETIFNTGTINNTNEVALQLNTSNNTISAAADQTAFTSSQTINDGKWSHIVFRRSGSTMELFINGIKDSNTGTDGDTLNFDTCYFTIAERFQPSFPSCTAGSAIDDDFGSWMDDLRVYNRALSDAEILRLYQLGEGRVVD